MKIPIKVVLGVLLIPLVLLSIFSRDFWVVGSTGSSCRDNLQQSKRMEVEKSLKEFCESGVATCDTKIFSGKNFWVATAWLNAPPSRAVVEDYLRARGWVRDTSTQGIVYRKGVYRSRFGKEGGKVHMTFSAYYCDEGGV